MSKNIIISATQLPFNGGASTVAYALIKYLRNNGHNSYGIFFNRSGGKADPYKYGQIYLIRTGITIYDKYNSKYDIDKDLDPNIIAKIKNEILSPDIIICIGLHTPSYMRHMYPNTKIIMITSGIILYKAFQNIKISIQELLKNPNVFEKAKRTSFGKQDVEDMRVSDMIIPNSPLMITIYNKIYPEYKYKISDSFIDTSKFVEIFNANTLMPNVEKDIDIIVVSSRLDRMEKNCAFLIPILKELNYKSCFVGSNNDAFKEIPNVILPNMINHNELNNYYARSKLLIVPSLYESSGNIIREALPHNCLILLSNNVGFYSAFPEVSVCQTFNENEWKDKIIYLIENYKDIIVDYKIKFNETHDIFTMIY